MAKSAWGDSDNGHPMQSMSAKDAKYGFGRLIDLARSEPVTVEKHGRPVVVVMAVEEYERLRESADGTAASSKTSADAAKRRKGTKQA
jgi:prevent-host-death family protein